MSDAIRYVGSTHGGYQSRRGLRRRLRRAMGRLGSLERKALASMTFSGRNSGARYIAPRGRTNYRRDVGDGTSSSAVMAPLLFLARTFPEAPVMVSAIKPDGTAEPMYEHPMLERLDRPNEAYSGVLLWMATILDYTASGNAYWIKVRGTLNRVTELWYTPSWMMKPIWPEDGSVFISHYEYRPDASRKPVRVEVPDVVHFRFGLNTHNPRVGISPLASVLSEVFTDDEAAAFTATLLRNAGVPGVIIMPDADSEIDDAEAIKADYRDKTTGANRGEAIVLTAGVKLEKISFSPVELDLKALRRIPEERITAVLGIPAIVAGLGAGLDRSTFSNMAEAREMAYESNILPSHRVFAAELKTQLLDDFDVTDRTRRVYFDTSSVRVLQEDEDKRVTRLNAELASGGIMLSEYRSALGLPTDATHDIYLRPVSVLEVPAGASGRTVDAPATEPKARHMFRELEPLAIGAGAKADQLDSARRLGAALNRRLERERRNQADAFAAALERKYRRLARMIGDAIAERAKSGPAVSTKADDEPADFPDDWPQWLRDMATGVLTIQTLMPAELSGMYLAAEFQAAYAAIGEATYAAVSDALGVVVGWDLNDPLNQALLNQGATNAGLVNVSQQTQDAVYKALAEGRAAGDSIPQLIRRVESMVDGCSLYPGICAADGDDAAAKYRAQVIARTESKTAQNLSSLHAMLKSEIVESVLVFDGDGCGWTGHADSDLADGSIRSLEAAQQYPLAHPQCVRSFAPIPRQA